MNSLFALVHTFFFQCFKHRLAHNQDRTPTSTPRRRPHCSSSFGEACDDATSTPVTDRVPMPASWRTHMFCYIIRDCGQMKPKDVSSVLLNARMLTTYIYETGHNLSSLPSSLRARRQYLVLFQFPPLHFFLFIFHLVQLRKTGIAIPLWKSASDIAFNDMQSLPTVRMYIYVRYIHASNISRHHNIPSFHYPCRPPLHRSSCSNRASFIACACLSVHPCTCSCFSFGLTPLLCCLIATSTRYDMLCTSKACEKGLALVIPGKVLF